MSKRRNQRGVALLATGLAVIVIVPAVGLGIDGATLYAIRARLSQGVDAGVLAGARSLSSGSDIASQRASAIATATKYFYGNFPVGFFGTKNCAINISVSQNDTTRMRSVTATASVNAPLYFMSVITGRLPLIQITGTATRRDVNLMLVLDRSGSMVLGNAIAPLQAAATTFVDKFANGRDNVGLATFGGGTYIAYHPSVNFKTDSPNVDTLISRVVGGGATNTSQALWLAYQELLNLNQPGALNVIVLFTDGRPTAFTANFQPDLALLSTCDKSTPKVGYLYGESSLLGIVNAFPSSITDVAESTPAANSNNCAYFTNFQRVAQDVARMPDTDYYGNSTDSGYRNVNLLSVTRNQVQAASINAADSAATRIRADARFQPLILTIGLGGTSGAPPDQAFMQRISNDPASPSYISTEPAGLYVFAPSTGQLNDAFLRIASEILRLAQ